jgi:hypothetical protein
MLSHGNSGYTNLSHYYVLVQCVTLYAIYVYIHIFNRNWVDTWWQQYSTHKLGATCYKDLSIVWTIHFKLLQK